MYFHHRIRVVKGVDDMLVAAGGILPDEDLPAIKEMGIKGCFGPGTSMEEIIEVVCSNGEADRLTTEEEVPLGKHR